jgi:hypothetical protein
LNSPVQGHQGDPPEREARPGLSQFGRAFEQLDWDGLNAGAVLVLAIVILGLIARRPRRETA